MFKLFADIFQKPDAFFAGLSLFLLFYTMSTTEEKRAPRTHPAYAVMVADAIKALKERSGSSGAAIKKYIGATFKGMTTGKPPSR